MVFVLGMVLAAAPQSWLNHRHHGSHSPLVMAGAEGNSLFARQLIWGITMQRYGTMFDPALGAGHGVYSIDAAGIRLCLYRYLNLLIHHPLHFLSTYTRHFVNALGVRDGEVYMRDMDRRWTGWSLLAFLLLFCSAAVGVARR